MRIAFWNIHRQDLQIEVTALCRTQDLDVLILLESDLDVTVTLNDLNKDRTAEMYRHCSTGLDSLFQVYTRLRARALRSVRDDERWSILRWKGKNTHVLLGVVHLPSAMWRQEGGLSRAAGHYAREIEVVEKIQKSDRLVLCGDFNLEPYDLGISGIHGFNAVPTKSEAEEGVRSRDGLTKKFYYNPMWSFFGDLSAGSPGTFYRSQEDVRWRMLDQVLVRPSLLDAFQTSELQIVNSISGVSLATAGGKPKSKLSDHFPVVFALDLKEN